ncbi:hypothetical protein DINM_001813 [Dirofilaria immitis]|nr:hypothetical protein [Dirofilaria immitis]
MEEYKGKGTRGQVVVRSTRPIALISVGGQDSHDMHMQMHMHMHYTHAHAYAQAHALTHAHKQHKKWKHGARPVIHFNRPSVPFIVHLYTSLLPSLSLSSSSLSSIVAAVMTRTAAAATATAIVTTTATANAIAIIAVIEESIKHMKFWSENLKEKKTSRTSSSSFNCPTVTAISVGQ